MRNIVFGTGSLCALLAGGAAFADQTSVRTLDQIIVTATGQASAVRDVQASVDVVERDRLERYGDTSVGQSLKHVLGVSASSSGATGDLSLRGFNRNHTLILVDGFRRTNNYGSNNISQVGFFDIERIEIVRGPLSSLYGSDALGGVVNVITRHPGEGAGTQVLVRVGSADGGRESIASGINHRTGDTVLGHSFTIEQNLRGRLRHPDSASDDYGRLNNWSGSYRGRWTPDAMHSLGWAVEVFDRDSEAKATGAGGSHVRYEKETRHFGSLDYRGAIADGELVVRASSGRSKGSTNRSHPAVETTDFRQLQADAVYHFEPGTTHFGSVGIGGTRDVLDVSINSRKASRNNRFVLLQDQWQITDHWQLVAGVRHDRFDDFGGTSNPRLSLGWLDGTWSARLGYGSAFRAPSLLEQYSRFTRGRLLIRGNPELKPEESKTWEAMLRREFGAGYVELTLHRNRVHELIESFTTTEMAGPLRVVEYRNIGRAKIDGAEFIARWPLSHGWSVIGSAEMLRATNADTGDRLSGRARQTWRLEALYERGAWGMSARARHMRDYLAVGIDAPRGALPYNSNLTVADLGVQYQHRKGLVLTAGVDNLFDRRDPDNFSVTSTGTQRNDPDARYFHLGARVAF